MSTSMSSPIASNDRRPGSASTIAVRELTGFHVLKIDGYSRTKMVVNGKCIKSCEFHAGGHSWCIDYYPNGFRTEFADSISLFLAITNYAKNVQAQFQFSLLDLAGKPVPSYSRTCEMRSFSSSTGPWGFDSFITREVLEKSEHLKYDTFTIRCDITVITATKESRVEAPSVRVPLSDLHCHLGDLSRTKQGADVTFKVGKERFSAHRCVLAARSPVFRAELYGFMTEKTATCIKIDDMEPQVFRNMLHFIYTDALPKKNEQEQEEEAVAMAQHLLVAADRYGLERLKLICEDELCKHIDRNSVVATLELAEHAASL